MLIIFFITAFNCVENIVQHVGKCIKFFTLFVCGPQKMKLKKS